MIQNKYARRRRLKAHWRLPVFFFVAAAIIFSILLFTARPQPNQLQANQLPQNEPHDALEQPVDDWLLQLVNSSNPLPADYSLDSSQLVTLANGKQVDERCYSDLQAMVDACRAEGLSLVICSAYRSGDYQQNLFQNKVAEYLQQGYSEEQAENLAAQVVARPGTSEHQLGLAVDIVDMANQNLDETQEQTAVQQWLMAHSWEYGFIMRYPLDKSDITGIIYEPWHYRYVGRQAAKIIFEENLCLEEYCDRLNKE